MAENRRYQRITFESPVKVHPINPSKTGNILEVAQEPLTAQATDISKEGMRITSKKPLSPKSILKINFEIFKNRPLDVFAMVVWSREGHSGLQFMVPDSPTRKTLAILTQAKNLSL